VSLAYALFLLAWSLVITLATGLFGTRRGLSAFRASYAKDRLPPVTKEERRRLPTLGGCIACGLCDFAGAVQQVPREAGPSAFRGVMDLALASSRSMPDYDAAARSFAGASDTVLAEAEALCPTRVPLRELRQFVVDKAREMGTHGTVTP
jgi:succinate dehydrogenase/fumarate reductase-like Fe-S protein